MATAASCTVSELTELITCNSDGMTMLPSRTMDEVYPGLFVGEEIAAHEHIHLKKAGISHVLNAAKGPNNSYHSCIKSEDFKNTGIVYKELEISDLDSFPISMHFDEASDYIEDVLSQGGKVLVHCKVGASRSATIALAFLMIKRHKTAQEAVQQVRACREICPNNGFLQQLCDLNDKLLQQGHFDKNT